MRVRALSNSGETLPQSSLDERRGFARSTRFRITVGAEYVVYAATVFLGHIWYYLVDDDKMAYPIWYPSGLFQVTEARLSQFWRYQYYPGDGSRDAQPIFAFPEWAADRGYYERLVSGEVEARGVFAKYKRLMDQERYAPDPGCDVAS